jgi:GNAT superfamily N-acetyltransferase
MPRPSKLLRKLLVSERHLIRDHLLRLDPEDRRLRFCGAVGDAFVEAYSQTALATGDVALGYFIDGKLRALGELRHQGDLWHRAAEAAVTVERTWQNQGIGTTLLRELVELAQNRSIRTLHLFCLTDNDKMRHVAAKLGGTLNIAEGEVAAEIAPPYPTCWSLIDEAIVDGQSMLHAWWGETPQAAPRRDLRPG